MGSSWIRVPAQGKPKPELRNCLLQVGMAHVIGRGIIVGVAQGRPQWHVGPQDVWCVVSGEVQGRLYSLPHLLPAGGDSRKQAQGILR